MVATLTIKEHHKIEIKTLCKLYQYHAKVIIRQKKFKRLPARPAPATPNKEPRVAAPAVVAIPAAAPVPMITPAPAATSGAAKPPVSPEKLVLIKEFI